jgi:hypothetical protein
LYAQIEIKGRKASTKDQRNFIFREAKVKAEQRGMQKNPVVPQLGWMSGFLVFCCQWEEYVSAQRFWCEQVSLGNETGCFFPWLITIFGELMDLLQSTPSGVS